MKYETFAPLFPGFYNTVFECSCEESEMYNYNNENSTTYGYEDFSWDYTEYNNRIAKTFLNRLEKELNFFLPIKIEFQRVHSPREYNFNNDSIYITVELDLPTLMNLIKERRKDAASYFRATYTSYSGFISNHSNDITDWLNEAYILQNPEHKIGALLNCLCFCEINQDDIIYWCDDETGYISYTLNEQETID